MCALTELIAVLDRRIGQYFIMQDDARDRWHTARSDNEKRALAGEWANINGVLAGLQIARDDARVALAEQRLADTILQIKGAA